MRSKTSHKRSHRKKRVLTKTQAEALTEALGLLERGKLPLCSQNDAEATYAPLLEREDGRVRWDDPAEAVYNRFRGVYAWPGTWTTHQGAPLRVPALALVGGDARGEPGEVLDVTPGGVSVAAGEGAALLQTVQPPGKRAMPAGDWANGYGVARGVRLG